MPRLLPFLCALAVAACGEREKAAPGAPAPGTTLAGRIDKVDGIAVVRVRGTPKEMGTQAGTLLKEQIRILLRDYLGAVLPEDRTLVMLAARQMEVHIPARYREEMRAPAEAAGVPYDDVLVGNVMVELFQQCSTAVVRGPRAEGGTLLFGRNLDFPPEGSLEKHSVVIEYAPTDGRRFVAVTWPGLVGVLSGMNRDGLCVANLLAVSADTSLDGCPYMFLLRDVMEGSGTVEEGLALLRESRRTTANSIMLADAKGAAVAETSHQEMAVREIEDDRLFATNDFRADTDVRCDRYDTLAELVAGAKAPLGVADMERLLDAVDLGDINVQCMVLIPARRELRVSLGRIPAAKGPFVVLRPWD
ncbi:MAG: C45 family peptidase [Planctomycetes bacterium]|nr:C45 family peptidase [Planctomycetota bacterium]